MNKNNAEETIDMMTDFYCILKYVYERLAELKEELFCKRKHNKFDNETKNIFLLTSPEYGNLGDHAIASSMLGFVKEQFSEYKIYEIPDSEFGNSISWIVKNNKRDDFIFLIGGGNFGILYPKIEYWRRLVIRKCKNAKIVLFPQSSVWRTDLHDKLQLQRSIRIYSNNQNLYLMAREKNTYNLIKQNFKNKVYLTPDIVLTKKYVANLTEKSDYKDTVLLCFRNDIEKSLKTETITEIEKIISSKGYLMKNFDTETYRVIPAANREAVLRETMQLFFNSRYVITDRLHGMIFAAINGVPCLAFDNTTHKVSGVADKWLSDGNVIIYDNNYALDDQINMLFQEKRYAYNQESALKVFNAVFREIADKEGVY